MRISDWSSDVCSSDLVVFDDAVSNSINYGFDDQAEHEIEVRMTLSERRLRLEVIDDGIAFDPLRNEDPDVELDIDERKIGGLGIYLIKNIMDDVKYVREGNYNRLIMEKAVRTEENTSELQSLLRISYAVLCLKKKKKRDTN